MRTFPTSVTEPLVDIVAYGWLFTETRVGVPPVPGGTVIVTDVRLAGEVVVKV